MMNTVIPLYSHTPWDQKKNGMIIKILYDVTKERFFLISLLVTWANANVLIGRDVTISGVTIKGDDCIHIIIFHFRHLHKMFTYRRVLLVKSYEIEIVTLHITM